MCSLQLPPTIIKQVDRHRKHCVWSGSDINRTGSCLAVWETACRTKGGLGIINMKNQNVALLNKFLDKFTLLKGPDYLPSCLSGLILLVTRGKSFSKMKLGEQMVFFNENGGTLLKKNIYKRWRIDTRKSSKDVFDSIIVTLWFLVDNIQLKVTSLSAWFLFMICWHDMFTWQPMQMLSKSAANFCEYLLQVCISEKMLHHYKLIYYVGEVIPFM